MKNILYLFTAFVLFIGCNSDDDSSNTELSGNYTEISPIKGRTEINFISASQLVINKHEIINTSEKFNYRIENKYIYLTPINTTGILGSKFAITIMNKKKFEIENLYPNTPEAPKSYITFER